MYLAKFFVFVGIIVVSFSSSVYAASFDCHKATLVSERLICGSKDLSNLDVKLNQLYKQELNKTYVDTETLVFEQREWLKKRNQCEYSFDCLNALITQRIAEFKPITTQSAAYSWGGKLRAEPNLTSKQVGSTKERQAIVVLQKTPDVMNGYAWFLIEANGITAYQWGGILCAPGITGSYCAN